MVTSFHHQPEAQHPKSAAIHKYVGRLPHLSANNGRSKGLHTHPQIRNRLKILGAPEGVPR